MSANTFWRNFSRANPTAMCLDPGTGKALPNDRSGVTPFTIAASASETNTLAAPIKAGLMYTLNARTVGASGTRAVTVAAAFNSAGDTVLTFSAAGQYAILFSVPASSSTYAWKLVAATAGISSGGTKYGTVNLPLVGFRAIASNDIPALAGTPASGILASDSAPKLKRANAATDKALKLEWAASGVIEVTQDFQYPADMDVTSAYTVNLGIEMGGATDTPVTTVGVFEGKGDTNRGGDTSAASSTLTNLSVSVTPTTANSHASVSITPGTHGTDVLRIYWAYINYKRKLI